MLGRIMVFLGGLVVVALFAALLAPLFVNWTDFRKDFEDQASRIIGKKVTVLGAVDARILPFPSVTLHDVIVGQDADGTPLVRVARFSIDAELAPFLSGEARIFDMRIDEPQGRIRLLKDGTLDWLRGSKADIPARTVVLEKVHITNGTIAFIDEQSGRTRNVTGLNADMSAASLAGPWNADGSAVVDGEAGRFTLASLQPNALSAAVPVRLRLQPAARPFELELDGALSVEDGRPGYKGTFQAEWRATVADDVKPAAKPPAGPRVKGDFELTNERIRIPAYRLELGDAENPYAVTGEATLDAGAKPEFLLTAEGQQIDVNQIGNGGQNGKTGRDPAGSVRKRLNTLVSMAAAIPVPNVPGRASLSLPAIVAGDTVIRDIRLDIRPAGRGWTVDNVVATLPGRTQVEGKGRLALDGEPSFAGDLLVASTQPSGLSAWISGNVDPAIRQLKSVGFSALVNLTPDLQRFEKLELAIGPAVLHGRVERQSYAGRTANLSLDLTGNAIDLDAVRAMATLTTGEEAGESLVHHDIGARLKVDTFTAFGIEARDVDTVFTLARDGLSVEKLKIGDIAGAAVTATGHALGLSPDSGGEADISVRAKDPGPFLAMLQQHLPAHPLLDRLRVNAGWYADTALTGHLAFGMPAGGASLRVGGTANGSRIDINYAADNVTGGGGLTVDATLRNPNTAILFGQAGFEPLPFAADSNGQLVISAKRAGDALADVAVTYTALESRFSATGQVDLGSERFLQGSGTLNLESTDLEPYLMMNAVALPQTGAGLPLKLSTDFTIGDRQATLSKITADGGGNAVSGELALNWQQPGLKAEGNIDVDTASLAWLAEPVVGPLVNAATGAPETGALPPAISDGLDLKLKLTARTFWPDLFSAASDFSADLSLKGGELGLEAIAGKWLGGDMSGRLMLANGNGTGFLQSRLAVAGGDLQAVLSDAGAGSAARGRFDLTLVAEATGSSAHDLLAAINGSGELKLSGLTVARLDTGLFQPLLAAADDIKGDITTVAVAPLVGRLIGDGDSVLGDVTIPFNITDGVVRVQNAAAANAQAALSGDARIDLAAASIDATVSMTLAPGDEALSGAEPAMRILLSGDIAAPERKLDVTDVTNFLSLRAFERERRRVETLQANVLEKQRLRREVALYKFNAGERQLAREKAAAEEKARLEEETRQKVIADEAAKLAEAEAAKVAEADAQRKAAADAAAKAAEAEAKVAKEAEAKAAADAARKQEQPVPAPEPARATPAPPLRFDSLPGVE